MEQICRVCLGNTDPLVDIFAERQNEEEVSLAEMLNECADCKVKIDDELPKMICSACTLDAHTAFKFKRRYEQSYKLLTLKVEKRELEVDPDFCDMLEAEEWDLPTRDGIKIELDDDSPERESCDDFKEKDTCEEQNQQNLEIQKQASSEESFQENLSPPFAGFEDNKGNSNRYPMRQSKRQCYQALNKVLEWESESESSNNKTSCSNGFANKTPETGRPFKCTECPKAFNRLKTLKSHRRTHTGERPYRCPYCPKVFAQSHHARDHIRVHNEQRPHKCPHCPKAFRQKTNLTAHIYVHSSEGPYKCTECSKSFCRNYDLKAHLRVHTGDRPHKCTLCPKAFNRRRDLERHLRIHTGEHPYKCTQCTFKFARQDQLQLHIRGHEMGKIIPRAQRIKKEPKIKSKA